MCLMIDKPLMKKVFIVLLTVLIPLSGFAGGRNSRVSNLVYEFSQADGVNVVQMGSIATSVMKRIISSSVDRNDPEELALLEAIKGVKRFTVIEYGDCDENTRNRLVRRLGRALPDEDVLMDIKDSGQQSMRLYGVVSDDGKTLKDFVIHSPESSALICLFGTISFDGISKFIEER